MQFCRPFDFSSNKFQVKSSTHELFSFNHIRVPTIFPTLQWLLLYSGILLSFIQWSLCWRKEESPFCIGSSKCASTRIACTWFSSPSQSWYELIDLNVHIYTIYICLNIFPSFLKVPKIVDSNCVGLLTFQVTNFKWSQVHMNIFSFNHVKLELSSTPFSDCFCICVDIYLLDNEVNVEGKRNHLSGFASLQANAHLPELHLPDVQAHHSHGMKSLIWMNKFVKFIFV